MPAVEVSGSLSASSARGGASSIELRDVVATRTASTGTVVVTGNPAGSTGGRFAGEVRYVVANQTTWVLGSAEFWRTLLQTSGLSSSLVSRLVPTLTKGWVQLIAASTTTFNAQTAGLIDPIGFAEEFLNRSASQFHNRGDVLLNGQNVVSLTTSRGATVKVRSTGPALPVAISSERPSPVRTSLSYRYPAHASISPPKHFRFLTAILKPYEKSAG